MESASATTEATWADVHEALLAAGWDLSNAHLDGEGGALARIDGPINTL